MKISSASKKVLASALSAAMVVAFAPTVALAAIDTANMPDGGSYVKGSTPIDGTVASYTDTIDGELATVCFTADLNDSSAKTALENAIVGANGKTVKLYQDITDNISVGESANLDLNGHTLSNDSDAKKGTATITITDGKALTVEGGTVTATQGKASEGYSNKAVSGGSLAVTSGTFDGEVESNVTEIKAGTFEGKVTDENGSIDASSADVTVLSVTAGTFNKGLEVTGTKDGDHDAIVAVKDATVKAESTKKTTSSENHDAVALSAAGMLVKVTGTVTAAASASGASSDATAVDGNVAISGDKAAFTATAATTGAKDYDAPDATGVNGTLTNDSTGEIKSTASVTATANDDEATATAVKNLTGKADLKATVAGEYDGTGVNALAVENLTGTVKGGTIVGKIGGTLTSKIAAGSFTHEIKESYLTNSSELGIVDDGTYYTVYAKSATAAADVSTGMLSDDSAIASVFNDVVEDVANGATPSNLKLAEGKTVADLQGAIKAGKVSYSAKTKAYKEKTATDAEKANYAAIKALAEGKNSYVGETVFTLSIEVTNGETDEAKKVVYGYITDMGKGARGVARTVRILNGSSASGTFYGNDFYITKNSVANWGDTVAVANDGKASDVELSAPKTGSVYDVDVTSCGMYAVYSLSASAIDKDKGDTPAAEKATQGIEVDQKSKTVKLAKKATKTKKAASFNLGATAQTGLSIAKASGSSKVTVSNSGKVTLKKGVKKGTYKATVTINAASSDQYLAAAKTVTVKFVVKK